MCRKASKVTASKRPFVRNCGYKNHRSLPKQIRLREPDLAQYRGHVGEVYVSGPGIQNDVMSFVLATDVMLKLEQSVPFDRDPNLKRKTDVTNLLAEPTKINNWAGNQRKLLKT